VIDPYAKTNERIRSKRRARGRRDDQYDAMIRAASQELGAATEAALGIFLDVAERVGLRSLEEAARKGATRRLRWTPEAVRAARYASSRLPGASGRVVSQSSEWAVRTGLAVLQEIRRRLEHARRDAAAGGDRARPAPGRRRPPPQRPARNSRRYSGRQGPRPGEGRQV
jgi:hypothetical protein